jgi:hypothetical protein
MLEYSILKYIMKKRGFDLHHYCNGWMSFTNSLQIICEVNLSTEEFTFEFIIEKALKLSMLKAYPVSNSDHFLKLYQDFRKSVFKLK